MGEWEELSLDPRHGWRARPGCKIFVADRGAVRFDYPQSWVVAADDDSIKLYDRAPPDDDCRLAVSYLRLAPIDWGGLKPATLVEAGIRGDERPIDMWGPIHEGERGDLELAWRESGFIDPVEDREAKTRMCIARRSNIQCLITFDFWVADRPRCAQVWETVLDTLRLAEYIDDPTRGPARA